MAESRVCTELDGKDFGEFTAYDSIENGYPRTGRGDLISEKNQDFDGGLQMTWVDVVLRTGNAVVLTRIVARAPTSPTTSR